MTEESRTCRECSATLSLAEFYRDKHGPGGYKSTCKACHGANVSRRQRANAGAVKAYQAEYRDRPGNREKARARTRQWVADNPERHRTTMEEFRADPVNQQIARLRAMAFRKANPERRREYGCRRRARLRASAVGRVITPEQLAAKKAYWGHRCWMCGGPAAAWDHVKPINRQGPHILANLRPACLPCNTRKKDTWPLAAVLARVA